MKAIDKTTAIVAVLCAAAAAAAQDGSVLEVKGRGVEGRTPYRGGGAVRFLDASLEAQVVHYDGGGETPLPLVVRYEVLEPAPISLASRLGTEYWRLYDFGAEGMAAMYADDRIDLAERGRGETRTTRAWFGPRYGPPPKRGLVAIRGRYYYLIERPDGSWIDVADPPAFFDQQEIGRKLTFTLADTSKFSISIPEIQSTWRPGGPFRVRVAITDAGGHVLPVVNAPVTASAGGWRSELATQWAPLSEPTGWMAGRLPQSTPEEIAVEAAVTVQTPSGPTQRKAAARFRRGRGLASDEAFEAATRGYKLPRDSQGRVRETRAIWVSLSDIADAAAIGELVDRVKRAGLNMILPDIFVRNNFLAVSDLLPSRGAAREGFDPLAELIDKAHAAGLEVHPWFCVAYRDSAFRKWFLDQHGSSIDMIDRNGKAVDLGADVHRPEYRRFISDLMIDVARNYDVDGVHLDYIRSMGRCFCPKCRAEFSQQFGKPLTDATEEEWTRWQRQAIGEIVRRTAEGVRRARPRARLSAAVFADMSGGALQGQDPAGWAAQGWLDLVIPMDYQMQTLQVRSNERRFLAALRDRDQLVTGLSLYMRSGGRVTPRPATLVCEQVELVRRMGVHGYCLFAYSHLSDEQLQALREQINPTPAVPYFR